MPCKSNTSLHTFHTAEWWGVVPTLLIGNSLEYSSGSRMNTSTTTTANRDTNAHLACKQNDQTIMVLLHSISPTSHTVLIFPFYCLLVFGIRSAKKCVAIYDTLKWDASLKIHRVKLWSRRKDLTSKMMSDIFGILVNRHHLVDVIYLFIHFFVLISMLMLNRIRTNFHRDDNYK